MPHYNNISEKFSIGSELPGIFVLTGGDGAGKTTACKLLLKKIEEQGYDGTVGYVSSTSIFSLILGIKEKKDIYIYISKLDVNSRTSLMFTAYKTFLEQASREHIPFILLDSYWYKYGASEIVYGADREMVYRLGRGLKTPLITFHLDMSADVTWQRKREMVSDYELGILGKKDRPASGIKELYVKFQSSLKNELLEIEKQFGPWVVLPGTDSAEETALNIYSRILEVLNNGQ